MSRSPRQSGHRGLRLALGAALLFRVLVPAGYMPAPLADGWILQLCPDGLPAATVRALLGPDHRHQHHHHAGLNAPAGDAATVDGATALPERCELGGVRHVRHRRHDRPARSRRAAEQNQDRRCGESARAA